MIIIKIIKLFKAIKMLMNLCKHNRWKSRTTIKMILKSKKPICQIQNIRNFIN